MTPTDADPIHSYRRMKALEKENLQLKALLDKMHDTMEVDLDQLHVRLKNDKDCLALITELRQDILEDMLEDEV